MSSLTPGALSKLLSGGDHAAGKHRPTLLQVIEIVPSFSASDTAGGWLSPAGGFFLKLSDSANSAYVSVTDHADAELVRSDAVRLGQFVQVARLDTAARVPVLRGLRPVPSGLRKPCLCIGNPVELVNSEALFQKNDKKRLSLDSHRRSWDINSNNNLVISSPLKASPKNVSSLKNANSIISPLKSKNGVATPLPTKKPPRKELKSSSEGTLPVGLMKVPVDGKSGSGQKISWDSLPPAISELGKQTAHHRRIAFSAAVRSLEEASAADEVIHCMSIFAELCKSSQKSPASSVVQKFMDLYPKMLSAAKAVDSSLNSSLPKNGSSWVKAALRTDLSTFSLLKNDQVQNDEKHHYVVIESPPSNGDSKKKSQRTLFSNSTAKKPPPTPARLSKLPLPTPARLSKPPLPAASARLAPAKEGSPKQSGLNEAASLSEKLLLASREWFMRYIEDSLDKGFGLKREERKSPKVVSLLGQLKRVEHWLDVSVTSVSRKDKKVESLRKKLHVFLSEHRDSAVCFGK